ncbi:ABC transporter substrate-binding protein [Saliphagus sp. GCM10025308]
MLGHSQGALVETTTKESATRSRSAQSRHSTTQSDRTSRQQPRSQRGANENGGIAGADVEIDIRNSNYEVQGTRSRYQELIQEAGAAMTMGPYVSENQLAIMDNIADSQTIHMGVASGTPGTTELLADDYERYKYYFRVGPLNGYFRGEELLKFAENHISDLGWERIAILVEDYEWTTPISEVIDGQIGEVTDAEVVMNTRFSGDTEDFSPLFDEAESADADGILTAIAHIGTDMIVQWYDQERPMGLAGTTVPAEDPNYWDDLDGSCAFVAGSLFGGVQGAYLTERGEEFAQTFAEADGPGVSPMYPAFHTYDAMYIFAEAVEEADDSLDPEDLIPVLEETSHDGSAGTIEFYGQDHEFPHDVKHGDDLLREMQYQWQPDGDGGEQVGIAPEEIATGEYQQPDWI